MDLQLNMHVVQLLGRLVVRQHACLQSGIQCGVRPHVDLVSRMIPQGIGGSWFLHRVIAIDVVWCKFAHQGFRSMGHHPDADAKVAYEDCSASVACVHHGEGRLCLACPLCRCPCPVALLKVLLLAAVLLLLARLPPLTNCPFM